MKLYKQIIFILIVFLKTETLLSKNNLFSVNNIQIEKNNKLSNNKLANKAIKIGFEQLISKILLKDDIKKISNLNFADVKELVTYYQISNITNEKNEELVSFSITFDKDKIHNLFYSRGLSYSEILDKEIYVLPILIKKNEFFVFNNNFFYDNWNEIYENDLIEFILPIENIEIIENINKVKNDLINLNIESIFKEYAKKNLALILIEDNNINKKVYLKIKVQGKKISKGLNFKKQSEEMNNFNERILSVSKEEIINLIKSENLIDIRTPSFLNVKLNLSKKTSLVEFNSRIKKIDLIENIYVQEFNKDYMLLRIKYLGKLKRIINQLKNSNIDLKMVNDAWEIKIL